MINRNYLAANLKHAPGCRSKRYTGSALDKLPCTCSVADILAAWDAREETLTAADYYIYELENGEDWSDDIDHESNWNEARRALADLETTMLTEIKHCTTGAVIFSAEAAGVKAALEIAVSSGADLSGADLFGADLSGANLSEAYLYKANLSGANLSGANLSEAHLYGANLSGAHLYGANLYKANLHGANLSEANLYKANLHGANLSEANLYEANLYEANLYKANLSGADTIDAGQDSRGYRFVGWLRNGVIQIRAGCRNFTLDEGRAHWSDRHDPALRAECLAKLDLIEAVATARGWVAAKARRALADTKDEQ